jgi:hypothetical protein
VGLQPSTGQAGHAPQPPAEVVPGVTLSTDIICVLTYAKRLQLPPGSLAMGYFGGTFERAKQTNEVNNFRSVKIFFVLQRPAQRNILDTIAVALYKHPDFENDARRKMTKTNNYFYIQQLVGTTVSLEVCF